MKFYCFLFVFFVCIGYDFGQKITSDDLDNLIQNEKFDLLKTEFQKTNNSEISYVSYLRNKALFFSQNKNNLLAIKIMEHCCSLANNQYDDCDTIKINSLHLLGRYYSFANESDLSLQTNKLCLNKRLSCENIDPLDIAKSYNNIGLFFLNVKNFDSSLFYFKEAYRYLKLGNYKNSNLTQLIYRNYLNNLTQVSDIVEGSKIIKKWTKLNLNSSQQMDIIIQVNYSIYDLLKANNLKSAFKYLDLNQKFITKIFGENSQILMDNKMGFAYSLNNLDFKNEAFSYLKAIKKDFDNLEDYSKLQFKNNYSVSMMDLDQNSEALKSFLEIKPLILSKYPDSILTFRLLSNISLCYWKICDLNNVNSLRNQIDGIYFRNKTKIDFQEIYEKYLERNAEYFYRFEDYNRFEETLLKLIELYDDLQKFDKKNYTKLKLSNLYLFQKINKEYSLSLLNQVFNDLKYSRDLDLATANYNYYFGEFLRSNLSNEQYDYYKKAYFFYDTNNINSSEYVNSMKHYADFLLRSGDYQNGKMLFKKWLGDYDSTNNFSLSDYLDRKTWHLFYINKFQDDSTNFKDASDLIFEIKTKIGTENMLFRKAAKFFDFLILDDETRKELILDWISSHKNDRNLDFYIAKEALSSYYFDLGQLSKADEIWNEILTESVSLTKDERDQMIGYYINYLIFDKKSDYLDAILLLENQGIYAHDFDNKKSDDYYFCYMGLKENKKVLNFLSEKEKFILQKYSENSLEYFDLIDKYILYYETINNYNLEKLYRNKELELLYNYQPKNKTLILQKTSRLVSLLLKEFSLYENSLSIIKETKKKFQFDFNSFEDLNEASILSDEILCKLGLYLLSKSYNSIDSIKLQNKTLISGLNSLKTKYFEKANILSIEFRIEMSNSWDRINFNSDSLYQLSENLNNIIKKSGYSDYFYNVDNSFEIRSLINKGEIILAKQIAIKTNNLLVLEEISLQEDNNIQAFNYRFEIEQNDLKKIVNSAQSLSDIQLDESRKIQKNSLNFAIGQYLMDTENQTDEVIQKCFELIINNNGLLSNLNRNFYRYIRSADSTTKNQYYFLSKINQENQFERSNKNVNSSYYKDIELKYNLKLLERESIDLNWIKFNDIQSTLNDTAAFVINYKYVYNGFEDYDINKPKQKNYYLTFIILKNKTSPIFILDSTNVKNEEDLVALYIERVMRKDKINEFSFFYDRIWEQIDKRIPTEIKSVYFFPDGIYNSINLSAIYDKKSEKTILEKYSINQLNSLNLAQNNFDKTGNTEKITSAVLLGYPNYSGQTFSNESSASDSLNINLDKYYSIATRGSIAKSLPGTKIEIEKINTLFTNNGIKTDVLMENNATEDNLKKIVAPNVLHIATHGFFINSKEGTPMLNSGLLLAGSNRKTKKIEDGYLSAYETSLLNLENTKLVVLSACETGRGVMKDGDGVFGLKQGCLNAGAKNIIMSLWKVDDKVTQEFMSRFYEIWLNDKTNIREAFNKTQLEIKAKYPEPYYWGAFILVGE